MLSVRLGCTLSERVVDICKIAGLRVNSNFVGCWFLVFVRRETRKPIVEKGTNLLVQILIKATHGKISRDLRRIIIASYENATSEVGENEIIYVNKYINKVVDHLRMSQLKWMERFASYVEAMYLMTNGFFEDKSVLHMKPFRLICAALFYVCNPFDIIPDFEPGIGYLDDVIVVCHCLRQLRRDYRPLYESIRKAVG